MGIPALEDELLANLLIFDGLYYIFLFGKGKRKGKGKGKGKGEGKGNGREKRKGMTNIAREPSCEEGWVAGSPAGAPRTSAPEQISGSAVVTEIEQVFLSQNLLRLILIKPPASKGHTTLQ